MSALPEHAHRSPAGGLPHPVDRAGWTCCPGVVHEFHPGGGGRECGTLDPAAWYCGLPAAHSVHRTPARVRAELEGQP